MSAGYFETGLSIMSRSCEDAWFLHFCYFCFSYLFRHFRCLSYL